MEIYKSSSEAGQEVRSRGQAINNRQVPTEPENPPLAPLRPARTALQPPSEARPPEELFDAINASVWGGGKPDTTAPSEPNDMDAAFNKINESIFGKAPERSAEAAPQGNKDAGVVSDIGNLLGLGVNNLALSVRELVGRIPGVGQSIVSGLDSIDQWASGKSSEALLKDNIKQGQAALTTETRAAQDKDWWDSDKGTFGTAWSDPRAYMSGVFQSLPEQAVTMFPVMRMAKGIYATRMAGAEAAQLSAANSARTASLNSGATAGSAEIAAGLAAQKALKDLSTQAAAASARAATIAGGISEGLLAGSGSSREVRDEIMKMTPEQLGQSDAMRTLTDNGMDFETARRTLAEDSATQAFVLSGAVTGLFGGLGDRFLAKAITKGAGTSIVGRTTKGVLTQGGEELPQEYGSKVAQNFALQNANPNLELTEGALNQGLGGLATGGIQGGFTAGVFGKREGQPETRVVSSSSGPVTVTYEEDVDPTTAQGTRQQFALTDQEFSDVTQDRDYMAAAYALADDAGRMLLEQASPELNFALASRDPGAVERGTAMINENPQFYEGFIQRLNQMSEQIEAGGVKGSADLPFDGGDIPSNITGPTINVRQRMSQAKDLAEEGQAEAAGLLTRDNPLQSKSPTTPNVSERLQTFQKMRKNLVKSDNEKWEVPSVEADYSIANLTPDIYKIADLFGVKVVGFKYTGKDTKIGRRSGISTPDGIALNVNSRDQFLTVFGHEIYHNLSKRDRVVAQELETKVLGYIAEEGKQGLRTKLANIGYTPDKINEETVADVMSVMFQDPIFWEQLGQEKPSLLQKVIRVIDDMIKRFGQMDNRSSELSQYISEMETVRDMMSDFVSQALDKQDMKNQEMDDSIQVGDDPVGQFRELASAGNKSGAAKVFSAAKLRSQLGDFNTAFAQASQQAVGAINETKEPSSAATVNTSTPDSGRIKALQLRAGLLADAGRLNAAESAEVSGLLDAGNVSAARSLLDNYSLRTWQKKPTQAEQEEKVQFDKDVEMPPPRPPGQFEDGTAISVGTVSPIVKEPTDLGTASAESEKERKQRVDERAEMYRQSYSDGVARAFIKQSLDSKGDKDILIQTEYEFVDGDRVVGKVFSAGGKYFRFNISKNGSYDKSKPADNITGLIAKPPKGSTLRRVRTGPDPVQSGLDLEGNKEQSNKYRAEVQRIMTQAFTPSQVQDTLANLRQELADESEKLFKFRKKKQSDVEYVFDQFNLSTDAPGTSDLKIDPDTGQRQEVKNKDSKLAAISKAIEAAQRGDVIARAGALRVHAAKISDSLAGLRRDMAEAGLAQRQINDIVGEAERSLQALQDETDPNVVLEETGNAQPTRDENTLPLPTKEFSDARLAAAAAVDEIVNGNTSPIAIVRRELNKPDREFSFSDLRKEMAARGMDISQIDREVAQWPAAQYSLAYWVQKNSEVMTPYAARLSWFNSHENIMAIYKDDPTMRGQYEAELSDVENRFIDAMRAERQAVRNRREESTDEFGQEYSDAKKAFPHALFNKYSLNDMRNLDESNISPEDVAVLRSLVGGNSTFLPRLWLDDVAFAMDARKDLRLEILEGMNKQERQAVERYLSMSASAIANNERISALRTYSTMLDNIEGLDRAGYEAFKKQIIYADLRAIPALLHRAQEVADITAQAKNKKELGEMLSAYLDKVYQNDERTSRTLDESQEEFTQIAGRGKPEVTDADVDSYLEQMNRLGAAEGQIDKKAARNNLIQEKIAQAAIKEIQTGIAADENQQAASETDQPENQAGLTGDIQYKRSRVSNGPIATIVDAHIKEITFGWKNKPNVTVYYNVGQIKDEQLHARLTERAESGAFKGAIDPNTGAIYIFSQHVEDLADAEFVLFHELYGHWGLRAFLGDKLNPFLENQYKLNKKIKAEADRQFDEALEDGSPMSRLESIEEAISDLAAKGEPNLFRQLIGQLVNWLRKHDMKTVANWIDSTGSSELAYILGQARKVARTGEGISPFNGAPQSVLYSRANKRPIEIFSQRDGKITGYARMNPVNQYWTVFTIKDIDTGDFGAITVEEVGDAAAILKKVGTISKTRDVNSAQIDPNNLEQIPDFNDLTGWKKFTRNMQIKGQNMFLPVFEVARFLESKGIKSTVIDDIVKYESRLGSFVTDFEKRFANPIQRSLKALGDKGATVEDVDLYMMARHARERNESINSINPTNFSGSGLSTSDAAQIIKDMEARPYINELNEIATLLDQMSKDKVNYMLQTGLINKPQHASLIKYDHYVNLSGNKKLGLDAYDIKSLGGKAFNLKGNDVIRSTGRGTQAVDVLQNTMNSYLATLMRGQKNRVMMSILQMMRQNPDPTYVAIEPIKERKTVNVERLNFDKKILRSIGDAPNETSGRAFLAKLKKGIEDGSKDPDEALDDLSAEINLAERRGDIQPDEAKAALDRINEAVVMSGRLSPDGYVSMVEDKSLMLDPAVLVAKENGKPVVIRFEDRGLEFVQAMTGMNVQESNGLVEAIGKWNRFFSQMVTTWNPAWLPINFIRDVQTAFANAAADPNVGAVLAKEMSKQWMPALKAAYKYTRGEQAEMKGKSFKDTLAPEWRDLIEEYFREGGGTFFLDRKGLEATLDKINRHINGPQGVLQKVEDKLEVVGDFMDLLATPSELAPRLAAYKVLKEAGRTPSEAARYAKELTVNFNMKGSAKSFRALYVFANPAIQGTYRMFQDYSRGEKGIARYMPSNRFAAVASAWMMLGIVSNYIARAIGGEDEERPGIDQLDTIPGFKRATSLVFMPNMIGGSIPVAYGWNVFSTAGTYLFDTMTGRMKPEVAATKVMAAAFDSFAPIGSGAESKTLTGQLFKTFAPSPFVPLYELSANENRFGAPIHKEQSPFSDVKEADAYMHFNSVNPISKGLMQTVSQLTSDGNPRYRPGLVDVNPAVVDHMISSYLPGLFSEAYRGVGWTINKLAGRNVKDMPIPIVDRFNAKTPEGFDTGAMRRVSEKVSTLYKEAMAPDTSEARREQILREHRGLGSTQAILAGTSEQLKTISRNLQAIERNPNLSEKEKIDFRNQMEKLKKQYTKRVVDAAVRSGFQDEVTGNTADGFVGKAAERLRQ